MTSGLRRLSLAGVSFVLLGLALVVSQWWEGNRAGGLGGEELMYFPRGRFIKEAALGHEETLADLTWIRAVQYYGQHRLTDRHYEMIGHLMRVTTDLDPLFIAPYVFGALVMAQDCGDVDGALELLDRGIRKNPDSWELWFEKGFILFVSNRDYARSAECFRLAASMPGCPEYVLHFAAYASARGGYTDRALALWRKVAETTDNKFVRQLALENIRKLTGTLQKEAAPFGRSGRTREG